MAAGKDTYFLNDGNAVDVTLSHTIETNEVVVVEGWLGVSSKSGGSGDVVALQIGRAAYEFSVPSGLAVENGDIVYVEVADLTGHTPDDSAYSTTAGAGKVALFKAMREKDANNVVRGVFLGHFAS